MDEQKRKILVVDDEPEIVETLKHFLALKGYEATGAFSGEEALSLLEKDRPDLILLDLMMPGLSGADVARIIKGKYPSIKLIIITAYPEEGRMLARDTALEGLFIKPIGIQEIYSKLLDTFVQQDSFSAPGQARQGIKARVLLIKAKILLIERTPETYNFLKNKLDELAKRGENYVLEIASSEDEIMKKITSFNPDIFLANSALLKEWSVAFPAKLLSNSVSFREIITYNINSAKECKDPELDRLIKSIEIACFKNGLIEIRWVEI